MDVHTQQAAQATAFDPADFVSELHDEGLWPLNAGGDPQVPDSSTSVEEEGDHLTAYQITASVA
jgi:hypothetical protein